MDVTTRRHFQLVPNVTVTLVSRQIALPFGRLVNHLVIDANKINSTLFFYFQIWIEFSSNPLDLNIAVKVHLFSRYIPPVRELSFVQHKGICSQVEVSIQVTSG